VLSQGFSQFHQETLPPSAPSGVPLCLTPTEGVKTQKEEGCQNLTFRTHFGLIKLSCDDVWCTSSTQVYVNSYPGVCLLSIQVLALALHKHCAFSMRGHLTQVGETHHLALSCCALSLPQCAPLGSSALSTPQRSRESGPGGLTREVERPLPSNQPPMRPGESTPIAPR
jgi:hypothetical protein